MDYRLRNAPKLVCEAREVAWKRFCTANPCRMMARLIAANNFMKLATREERGITKSPLGFEESFLSIINGYWSHVSSSLGAVSALSIIPFYEGYRYPGVLDLTDDEKDCFSLLAHAAYQEGLILYVPANTHINVPLCIQYDLTKPLWAISRLHIILGENASLQITENASSAPSAVLNTLVTVTVGRGSLLTYRHNSVSPLISCFSLRATLEKDASFIFSQMISSISSRHSSVVSLGENACISMVGLSLLPSYYESSVQSYVNHIGERSRSRQIWKAVVADTGIASHSMTAVMRAADAESDQQSRFLTLGSKASVRHEPKFEILHDRVKASHGATTTMIEQEYLYYLQSRGISEQEAKWLCIEGFCHDIFPSLAQQEVDTIRKLI